MAFRVLDVAVETSIVGHATVAYFYSCAVAADHVNDNFDAFHGAMIQVENLSLHFLARLQGVITDLNNVGNHLGTKLV